MEFKDTEFEMRKAFREFEKNRDKLFNRKFTNADSVRNLENNSQLALMLWNMPKFKTIEELQTWLDTEYVRAWLE